MAIIPNLKHLPYGGAEAVVNPTTIYSIRLLAKQAIINDCLLNQTIHETYIEKYRQWILSSKLNQITGLENFPIAAYSNGTTESFDKFYLKHSQRRFRCFRGEYMYHQVAWRNYFPNWQFLDDGPILENDAVVISLPFSDYGYEHPKMQEILDVCNELGVPVLIDCAYFGICGNISFNFTHPAISDITFSLSKFLPVAHLRIGIRFTRKDDDDSLLVCHKTQYINRTGAAVGLSIFDTYTPDDIYAKYRPAQVNLCDQLGVTPSNCVIFGIDYDNIYPEYNRGTSTQRLSLSKYLHKNKLPTSNPIK
jgi:hypothetical protein